MSDWVKEMHCCKSKMECIFIWFYHFLFCFVNFLFFIYYFCFYSICYVPSALPSDGDFLRLLLLVW